LRATIDIDDVLMAEAQKVLGGAGKKRTIEEALRLMVRLHRQQEVGAAFGKYRWQGDLAQSRVGKPQLGPNRPKNRLYFLASC
jgi:Arc/MetJ family transcription regulator